MAKRNNTYSCWSILRNQIKLFQLELGPTVILQSLGVKPTRHLPVCRSQANPSPSCLWESGRPVTFQSVGVKLISHLLTCESQCNPSPSKLWESCRSILNTSTVYTWHMGTQSRTSTSLNKPIRAWRIDHNTGLRTSLKKG